MPRELTRQFVPANTTLAKPDHLQIRISQAERTVWVSLSGTLDRQGMARLVNRVVGRLDRRGYRIVLDGSRLAHLDFRATGELIAWHRRLRDFEHQLYLKDWSDYLKAILVMEDWDRELGPLGSEPTTWRLLGGLPAASRP